MSTHDTDWMREASCPDRVHLPWLADAEQTSEWDRITMAAVCETCPALASCRIFVASAEVTGGFWAGAHQDLPPALHGPSAPRPRWAVEQPVLPGFGDAA